MKIIIYNEHVPNNIDPKQYHFVSMPDSIDTVIEYLQGSDTTEDIEGLFTKDADKNPHFRYIVQQVYLYKKRLYEKEMQSDSAYANHVRKRHTIFKVRIQKHFPFDYPDCFFRDL